MESETSSSVYNILGGVMTATTLCSFIFNSCGIVVFIKNKKLLSTTNMFITALCVCDLFMCAPAAIAVVACFNQWSSYNVHLCSFGAFITFLFGLTSIYLCVAVSLDRYIILTKPTLAARMNKRATLFCVLVCFTLALALSIAPLAGWNTYTLEGIGISCSINWQTDHPNDISFIIFIFIVCFTLPILVIIFCYVNIYCTIYKKNRRSQWEAGSRIHEKNMAVEKRMIFTSVILVSMFVVSWTPYAVVSFMSAFGFSHLITPIVATIPAIIAKTSGIWNPVVYLATNQQFRHSLYSINPCVSLVERLRIYANDRVADANTSTHIDPAGAQASPRITSITTPVQ